MFVARWQIDTRFGHKQEAIALMQDWERDIGSKAGLDRSQSVLTTGSIGALEATIENNITVDSLAELETFFAAIAKIPAHAEWGKKLEPHVVSGTSRWNIYRVISSN
jgi:hypothetical protein